MTKPENKDKDKDKRKPPTNINHEQKVFIIRSLAHFNSLTETARLFFDEYNIDFPLPAIQRYDPTKVRGHDLKEEYKNLFFELRSQYMEQEQNIPIAHRFVRLKRLEDEYNNNDDPNIRLKVLEQASKEVGGLYTNKRDLDVNAEVGLLSAVMDELADESRENARDTN